MMQKANEGTAVYFTVSMSGLFLMLVTMHFANVMLMTSNQKARGLLARTIIKRAR